MSGRRSIRSGFAIVAIIVAWVAIAMLPAAAHADDAQDAQRLGDTAFVMLNRLSASTAPGAAEAQGAIASFAGDAQSLASALDKGDRDAASQAMAALVGDRRSVDQVLAKHPGVIDQAQWAALKTLLASIEHNVQPSHWKPVPSASGAADVPPPAVESAIIGTAPKVQITSRVFEGGRVRVLGYLRGTDLKSAGIYEGDDLLHPIQLGSTTGEQRVDFNFKFLNVTADDAIRVTDASGRTAQGMVAPQAAIAAPSSTGRSKLIEIGPGAGVSGATTPMEVASGTANIDEIPSRKGLRRPALGTPTGPSELADVQINILGVLGTSQPKTYQVVGQISGAGVQRAGIYVDGRLVKPIPVTPGQYTSFDVAFTMLGKRAAIRVFDRHNNSVESSIDVNSASGQIYGTNPPIGANPYAYGINPYPSPYGYGYPVSPYGASPYGVNPYGSVNPYAPRPYGASPYGYPAAPNTPWWRSMIP